MHVNSSPSDCISMRVVALRSFWCVARSPLTCYLITTAFAWCCDDLLERTAGGGDFTICISIGGEQRRRRRRPDACGAKLLCKSWRTLLKAQPLMKVKKIGKLLFKYRISKMSEDLLSWWNKRNTTKCCWTFLCCTHCKRSPIVISSLPKIRQAIQVIDKMIILNVTACVLRLLKNTRTSSLFWQNLYNFLELYRITQALMLLYWTKLY